jgi:hypothetical protein
VLFPETDREETVVAPAPNVPATVVLPVRAATVNLFVATEKSPVEFRVPPTTVLPVEEATVSLEAPTVKLPVDVNPLPTVKPEEFQVPAEIPSTVVVIVPLVPVSVTETEVSPAVIEEPPPPPPPAAQERLPDPSLVRTVEAAP